MEHQLDELRALTSHAQNRRTETGIPRVAMVQGHIAEHQLSAVYEPMINLILRGSKTISVAGRSWHYDPATYFVLSVGLPAAGVVHAAANGAPYLAVALSLDTSALRKLLDDLPDQWTAPAHAQHGFAVAGVTSELLDAWCRMLRLMQQPADIPALAPVYEREILYRVLQGPMGWMLRDIAIPDSAIARVNRAITQLRREYHRPLSVDQLASSVAMSSSAFHRHFKAVTAMSPLQYQKQLRLLQARHLMLTSGINVSAAAHSVGYQSSTQFSREYTREFGTAPGRDTERILHYLRNPS